MEGASWRHCPLPSAQCQQASSSRPQTLKMPDAESGSWQLAEVAEVADSLHFLIEQRTADSRERATDTSTKPKVTRRFRSRKRS